MTTQFDGIYRGLRPEVGKFRVAASGMAWKAEDSSDTLLMSAGDIKWAQWLRVARNHQLRVGLKDRRRETLDGFVREDHDKLTGLLKQHFGVTLETKDITFKGWNWGVTDFQGDDLAFLVSNKTSFELPTQYVINSNIAGKTEVSLEFSNPDANTGKKKHGADEMTEIRFYVPGTHTRVNRTSEDGSQKSDVEDEEEISAAQAFHDAVKEKAELGQVTGDLILSFEEVLVLTPRGRYDVDMFPDFLRLRGKTYDYKILYSAISKLFLLPKDDLHVLFIMALSNPIRQGQTRYQYLVMQFSKEEEMTAELNMPEEEIEKYEKLKKNYEELTFEVVSSVFRALSKRKIIGTGSFQSKSGQIGLKANLKAVQGDLFLLEKYIFFVSKQPSLIELSDIHQAVFSRVGSGAVRSFDLKIAPKIGAELTFTSINKEEHEPIEAYFKARKVRVKNEMMQDVDMMLAAAGADDDDDAEMQSVASSGEEAPAPRRGDDDEDSEEDEDFQASGSDSGSPSESDSSSGGGKTASDASGDREFTKNAKGKGKKKALTKKKPKDDAGSDAEGDDEPPKKKKPKKKADGDVDGDGESPKKKPKPKPKAKPKAADGDDEPMDVDGDGPSKPKPKPKPKTKPASHGDNDEGPAKKKVRKSDD